MSVARGLDLLERLASDPTLVADLQAATTRGAKRVIIDQAGFIDVTSQDLLQAIGSDVLRAIGGGTPLAGAGEPSLTREDVYSLAAMITDAAPGS
jgi:hypothetical protein